MFENGERQEGHFSNIISKKSQVRCCDRSSPDLFVIIVLCLIIVRFPGEGIRQERDGGRSKGVAASVLYISAVDNRERVSCERTVFLGSAREESPAKSRWPSNNEEVIDKESPAKLRWPSVNKEVDNEVSPANADRRRRGQRSKPSGRWLLTTRSTK